MKDWVFIFNGVVASGIRVFELFTKVLYLISEEFKSDLLYYTFIIALTIPVISSMLMYLAVKHNYHPVFRLYFTTYLISEFLGLSHLFYALMHVRYKKNVQSLKVLYNLVYLSTFIICALQSTPLLIIQVFNLNSVEDWNFVRIMALSATSACFFIPVYKFVIFGNDSNSQVYPKKELVIINETESNSHRTDIKIIEKTEKESEINVLNLE